MAKILVSENLPADWRIFEVQIDGQPVIGSRPHLQTGEVVRFDVAANIGDAPKVFRLGAEETYVAVYVSYNSRNRCALRRQTGIEEIYSANGRLGQRFVALFRVTADEWLLDLDVPGAHSHGTREERLVGTRETIRRADEERAVEEAPLV